MVLGLFLNTPETNALKLKLTEENKFITDSLKELSSRAPELGVMQYKLDRIQKLRPRIDYAIDGVHEVTRPIPEPAYHVVHHTTP